MLSGEGVNSGKQKTAVIGRWSSETDSQSTMDDECGWHTNSNQVGDEYFAQLIRQFTRIDNVYLS